MKTISIIIPVYNEKNTIEKVLKDVLKADSLSLAKEIIVIDDCSTDGTETVLSKYKNNHKVKVIKNSQNIGKGASLKLGFMHSKGDIVLIQDADLEYSPNEYPLLIKPIIEGYADVVYGSRFTTSNPHRVLYFYHFIANKFVTTLSNLFTNLNMTDIETGYKAFRGDIIRTLAPLLVSKRFGIEVEITARIAKIPNIKIYEVGISYFGRTYQEGKKITWWDGVKTVFEIVRYNLLP